MTQKTALILAAVLTAFVLVLGGGIVARVSQPAAARGRGQPRHQSSAAADVPPPT
jgi:hypothetical protein